jgi:hypothetical protein
MFERPNPILYFVLVLPLSLAALVAGYRHAFRHGERESEKGGWAYGLGQAAIFGLIALILGFSFSFAAERYEGRRELVVAEANAIGTAGLRGGFLPTAQRAEFRDLLIAYTRTRLATYADVNDALAERRDIDAGKALQGRMWVVASGAARRDPRDQYVLNLTRSVVETIDVSREQAAALATTYRESFSGSWYSARRLAPSSLA